METSIPVSTGKHSFFLILLCVFSGFSNLLSLFVTLMVLIYGKSVFFVDSVPVIDIMAEELRHGSIVFYFIKAGVHILCLFALVKLTRGLRKGLILYALCQLLLLALPWLFLQSLGVSYLIMITAISLIFALFFIMLFSLALPKKTEKAPEPLP
ncbi:MAG TPA: hypothetical protein PLI16_08245 [Bacteroidales bacterium]|nr:hypothetical protein [Bacteroidales bacterium]HOH84588.1 hypothetical protein [Bacteroidales bacterium]